MNGEERTKSVYISIGKLLITADAHSLLDEQSITDCLRRHIKGDWGDLEPQDKKTNDLAVETGESIVSAYHDTRGKKFYIVTDADRSMTTVLLPEDY